MTAGYKILIVEDDTTTAEILKRILQTLEYTGIRIVNSGEKAIEETKEFSPDIILMDICLSGEIDGIAASSEIQKFSDCPVIFITSSSDQDTADRAFKTDPYGYIIKPFIMRDISNLIRMTRQKYSLERRLKTSEALYKGIVEQFPLYILRVAPDRETITFANKNFTEGYSISEQDITGLKFRDVISDRMSSFFSEAFLSITTDNPIRQIEYKIPHEETDTWQRWICQGIYDSTGRPIEYQLLGDDITEIKNLQTEIIGAAERETRRLAGDLHDDLGQKLTYLGFLTQIIIREMSSAKLTPYPELEVMKDLIDESAAQMRRIYKGLVPVTIEPEGFIYAVEDFAVSSAKFLKRKIDFSVSGNIAINDSKTATNLFYISREAVNNALKHSGNGTIKISISCTDRIIMIFIENEIPQEKPMADNPNGMGLKFMKYRADLIGGSITIDRSENIFSVKISIPDKRTDGAC